MRFLVQRELAFTDNHCVLECKRCMPYRVHGSVLEYRYDERDANYDVLSVESLLQFSEPRRFKFSCQNSTKLLHNTAKCGMKGCFACHK